MYKITKSGERKPPQCQIKAETNMGEYILINEYFVI